MVRFGLVYWFVTLISLACCAQSVPESTAVDGNPRKDVVRSSTVSDDIVKHLATMETASAPSEMTTGFTKMECDGDGNLYLGGDGPGALAIRKLNPKGELRATFKPDQNPDLKVWNAGDFSVTQDGEVYVWVGLQDEITRYVLVFRSDGSYKEKIKLDTGFPWMPASIAVFPHGELLLTGQAYAKDPAQPMLPFTGIFAPNGKLLKTVGLDDDAKIQDLAAAHDAHFVSTMNPSSNRAVAWGRMAAAKDGNIYVMRWLSPAEFYAISPGGEVVRRFTVDPGNGGYMPSEMHIDGNRIAVLFVQAETRDKIMKVVDFEGHELETYDELKVNGKPRYGTIGSAFACYVFNPERFTFLSTDESHRIQIKAVVGR